MKKKKHIYLRSIYPPAPKKMGDKPLKAKLRILKEPIYYTDPPTRWQRFKHWLRCFWFQTILRRRNRSRPT